MSKGKSLTAYLNEASDGDVITLLKDLLAYYEENYEKEFSETTEDNDDEFFSYKTYSIEYARLYKKCREYMDRVLNISTPLAANAAELQQKFSSDYLAKQIELSIGHVRR